LTELLAIGKVKMLPPSVIFLITKRFKAK
jgi:hypothetical protein